MDRLLAIDRDGWLAALKSQEEFFGRFGTHLPEPMRKQHLDLKKRIEAHEEETVRARR